MGQLFCYKIKFNTDSVLISDSRALLHDYYVEHYRWNIPKQNPSGLKVEILNNKKSLTDRYDQYSIFFTVTNKDDKVASCARLCAGDEKNCLEIEKYENAQKSLQSILMKKDELNIIELAREGIDLKYLNDEYPYLLLLREIFEFCLNGGYSLLTTTNLLEWENIYKDIGFLKLENVAFKYFDNEPADVGVYLALVNQTKEIIDQINLRLKKYENYNE